MNNVTGEQKLLAILAHVSYFLAGLGFIIAPLALFLLRRDDYFVQEHAKQALVAHVAMLVLSSVVGMLCFLFVGVLLLPIVGILWILLFVTSLLGALKALNGEFYEYPFVQDFVKKL